MSFTETAVLTVGKDELIITRTSVINWPVELLSDNMQKASRAFYDVHNLLIRKKSPKALEQFTNSKNMIKSEFETVHRLLQSSYRHIIDFTSSCKRAPNERAVSAQRCQRSGRALLRDIQSITRTFDAVVETFKVQRSTLSTISSGNQYAKKGALAPAGELPPVYPFPEDSVSLLYDGLDDICSSLKDLFVFWDGHVSFLTLVLNRQTNYPNPGEETKDAVNLWSEYQRILLKANSSISQAIETMSQEPVIPIIMNRPRQMPWRRHTYPQTKLRREPTIVETIPKPAARWQEVSTRRSATLQISDRLTSFVRGLF
ncbi:hypothetical protein HYPSUDRAFT_52466 [Hypholoma sublateritium FD-334 SS-4]|uniref:Uncharacterized protein n=1 Tax=Hypholoma sublateritium (strain FD-334 SS-4) TaxID=945553 RepID=A0A0D2LG54_HYPSF|nr:hypothetical protein HYPSUDRAFT_52466 [Hypholoma sublateritium FD-334 SS-4]